jgi:hypothetical protein
MTVMSISLPHDMKVFVDSRVAEETVVAARALLS